MQWGVSGEIGNVNATHNWGGFMTDTYIEKRVLLQNWEEVSMQVKKGLRRLGHDILLAPEYKGDFSNRMKKSNKGG